jgi:hypothetical protein
MDFDFMMEDSWKRLHAVAKALVENSGLAEPREQLFHYTSAEGLVGIVDSKILRASDMLCLNDASEAEYANALIGEALGAVDPLLLPSEHRSEFMNSLRSAFRMYTPFVACFCEDPDLLSQWRGYGKAGEGFALGFSSSWLSSSAVVDDAKFLLLKVIYDPSEQRQLISTYIHNATGISARYQFSDDEEENWFWGTAANAMAHLVVAMKDPVFNEENEWRLVNPTIIQGVHYGYRVSGRRIVPYVNIPIADTAITSLVRGPHFAGDRGAEDLLRYSAFSTAAANVRDSKIPLRP